MTLSYSANRTEIYFGSADALAVLRPALSGSFTLTPVGTVVSAKIQGQTVRTADCVTVGFTASGTFYEGNPVDATEEAPVDTALDIPFGQGFLAIVRLDAAYGYFIPADINSVAPSEPADGYQTLAIGFKQRATGRAITGPLILAGEVYTKTADNFVGVVDVTGESAMMDTSSGTTPDDGYAIAGTGLIAEGVTE